MCVKHNPKTTGNTHIHVENKPQTFMDSQVVSSVLVRLLYMDVGVLAFVIKYIVKLKLCV